MDCIDTHTYICGILLYNLHLYTLYITCIYDNLKILDAGECVVYKIIHQCLFTKSKTLNKISRIISVNNDIGKTHMHVLVS